MLIRQFSCLLCRLHLKDLEKNQVNTKHWGNNVNYRSTCSDRHFYSCGRRSRGGGQRGPSNFWKACCRPPCELVVNKWWWWIEVDSAFEIIHTYCKHNTLIFELICFLFFLLDDRNVHDCQVCNDLVMQFVSTGSRLHGFWVNYFFFSPDLHCRQNGEFGPHDNQSKNRKASSRARPPGCQKTNQWGSKLIWPSY